MRHYKKILCLVTAFLMLCTVSACGKSGENKDDEANSSSGTKTSYKSSVKTLCYNVYYLEVERRQSDIIDFIKSVDADVLGLQEVTAEWRTFINAALIDTGEYSAYGFNRIGVDWDNLEKPTDGKEFSVILYKTAKYERVDEGHFWCSTTPDVYSAQIEGGIISETPRCINWVRLKDKETDDEFVFLNAHLDAYSEPVRDFSTKLITEQMKKMSKKYPVIMVGDWNAQLSSAALKYFSSNGYENTRYIADETSEKGTFQDFGKREEGAWLFGDVIFVNQGKTHVKKFDVLTNAQKDGVFLSDHHPLIAEIEY